MDRVTLSAVGEVLRDFREEIEGQLAKNPNQLFETALISRAEGLGLAIEHYANQMQHQRAGVITQGKTLPPHIAKVCG